VAVEVRVGVRNLVLFLYGLMVVGVAAAAQADVPRVAIWDPVQGGTENRFHLDPGELNQISAWLKEGRVSVARLTAQQMADPATFSAEKFDAALFVGNAFPRADLGALKQFADDGGVLVDLAAEVPFLICIAPGPDGVWDLSPAQPRFAWQNGDLDNLLGLRDAYDKTKLQDQGINHSATALFKRYFPQVPDLHGRLPSRWIVPLSPSKGTPGEIFPLIRSQRSDGADVPPQLYVVRSGPHLGIISTSDLYTSDKSPAVWPCARQTVLAIAQLASDLHSHSLELGPEMAVQIKEKEPLPQQPMDRLATGSIDPEHAQALVRWGKFDGSSMEFGPVLPAGSSIELPLGGTSAQFPQALENGASVRLALPPLEGGPLYLRIRGAYKASGAALKATLGTETILNESFVYIDTSGPSNFNHNLVGVPTEFTRIVFIPPSAVGASALLVSNPGNKPVYFDAMQIERRTEPAPQRWIGLGAGYGNNYPAEISRTWSAIRMSLRTNFAGPPDDPQRFAKMDELFEKIAALNGQVQPILEGTPAWCAISPERLEEAEKAKRPQTVPPDPQKYAQLVADVVKRYGSRVSSFEIWNEADLSQFYRGTPEEYANLFKTVAAEIRKLDPTAMILTSMSGYRPDYLQKLIDAGVPQLTDLIAFHPYAGKSPGWDVPYEQVEGYLMAHGIDKEVYCNECGFPWNNVEWFKPPPVFTPQVQRDLLNIAMARILASGLAKLCVFNAGGDDQPYGLFDAKGQPRPAYSVFADYVVLGQPTARRLDVCMTDASGAPLQGVYAAASVFDDGRVALVLNPAEAALSNSTLSVRVCLPLSASLPSSAVATADGQQIPVQLTLHRQPDQPWAEMVLPLKTRTLIQLR
jgi:hypothetical protein